MAAIVAACCVAYLFLFVQLHARAGQAFPSPSSSSSSTTASLSNNLHLTEKECRAAFPGLMDPIDKQVRRGPFPLHPASDLGPLQARVRNGRLRILSAEKHSMLPPELLDARVATLHQIERALLTAPSSPGGANALDTVFSVNVQDQPYGSAWTYSLPAYAAPTAGNAPIGRAFLMPHFSFWAWRPRMVGSFARAAAAIDAIEARLPFARKQAQAVWRGTARFASAHHPALRTDLLKATRGQPWADVQELAWLPEVVDSDKDNATRAVNALAMQDASNGLMIEDFCRYKYVVHTEGITYSGRFQFHQLCGSVVLTAPLAWMQHTTHLVRPLYASDVLGGGGGDANDDRRGATTTPDEEKAWPHAPPDAANIVFVAPDWSNLGAMVQWLEDHPAVAEGIARRQRSLFASGPHGRGYLSPAAEVCYWRALLAGWRQVVQYNDTEVGEGVPWELFSLEPRW
ncbi:hypothetical protein HMPREF1624_05463 [Sporothrix schenckii ATCC 58251]|uniref:Glycosyl transferase CAP10 domain-containing protein n=2 Tax=Sporothrix schenckii TaxID=29908 RepID=U7PUQ4_SPOS1|nr:hypothetical protein HMPREF1624_05463 [Sporothrix schenckii ATCC 58251]